MFDWLFKRSAKDYREGDHFVEPKFSDEQNIAPNGQDQLEQTEQDLIQIRDTLAQVLLSMSEKIAKLQASLDEASTKNILLQDQLDQNQRQLAAGNDSQLTLKAAESIVESGDINQQVKMITQELNSLKEENEILLSGMFEAQEELERQILSQQEFEQVKAVQDGRFERLTNRYSNYIDYSELKIISVDGIATIPEIAWEITEVFFAGIEFEKIEFKTLIKEGKIGLWISSMKKPEGKSIAFKDAATLFPELVNADISQQKLLRQIQTSHWRGFGAVVAAIELNLKTQWRDILLPVNFDPHFWGACLQPLSREFKRLPKVFRFEQAKLKQELVNPDYEHLWIELFDVVFGDVYLPKFEFRIGASQVDQKNFSTYTKLEIPLIDGKWKPFDSWFAESFDDFGSKLELRFDSDRKVVDRAVWSKISEVDRVFIFSLLTITPFLLKYVKDTRLKPERSIDEWLNLLINQYQILIALTYSSSNDVPPKKIDSRVLSYQQEFIESKKKKSENLNIGNTQMNKINLKNKNGRSSLKK